MSSVEDYFRFAREQRTVHENVRDLLKRFPECRDSYALLTNFYWYYVDGLHRWIPREVLKDLTSPESITRSYRKIIEGDPRLGPREVTRRRRDAQLERYRRFFGRDAERRRLML